MQLRTTNCSSEEVIERVIAGKCDAGFCIVDAVPPEIDIGVLRSYLLDVQFFLLVAAILWTAAVRRRRQAALLVAANLAVSIVFFMTHPVFTPYYTVPISMLSLWTLLFATLGPEGVGADNPAPAQPAAA